MTQKNPFGKERDVNDPYEVWLSYNREIEYRVLKKKSLDALICYCAVKSPGTFGDWEYGDVYVSQIQENAKRVYLDINAVRQYFGPVEVQGSSVEPPLFETPFTFLPVDKFDFLYDYFCENSMSFHCPDGLGNISFYLSIEEQLAKPLLETQCGLEYDFSEANKFFINLIFFDNPEDPLAVPFIFDFNDSMHVYELIRTIEEGAIHIYIFSLIDAQLKYCANRTLYLPEQVINELVAATLSRLEVKS